MTTGAWVLLASLALVVAVGLWRAYADGRFTGTHAITRRASGPVGRATSPVGRATRSVGRAASAASESRPPEPLLPADQLGDHATLLQFSSAFCAPCRATRRVLADIAAVVPGVTHVEIDAEHHLDLVRRVGVLRTPTTLVLDAQGREVTRASGTPRKEQVLSALAGVEA